MVLHERIQKLLNHRNWTRNKLAVHANIDPGALHRIMKASTKQPETDTLQKIARALDVTLDYLIDGEDEDFPDQRLATSQSLKAFFREDRKALAPEDCIALEKLLLAPQAPESVAEWKRLVIHLQHLGYFVGRLIPVLVFCVKEILPTRN